MKSWLILFSGLGILIFGIWLLIHMINATSKGYKSRLGNGIVLYIWAIGCILFGLFLIYQEAF